MANPTSTQEKKEEPRRGENKNKENQRLDPDAPRTEGQAQGSMGRGPRQGQQQGGNQERSGQQQGKQNLQQNQQNQQQNQQRHGGGQLGSRAEEEEE